MVAPVVVTVVVVTAATGLSLEECPQPVVINAKNRAVVRKSFLLSILAPNN